MIGAIITQHAIAAPPSRPTDLGSTTVRLSQPQLMNELKLEASQLKSALKSIEVSKDLKANHFTDAQLRVVTGLAKRFIECVNKNRRVLLCSKIREQMNQVDRKGKILETRIKDGDFYLNGPGDILSSLGDSFENVNDAKSLGLEYAEILKSIPKETHRGLPSVFEFSRLNAKQMQDLLNKRVYPLVGKVIEGFATPSESPTSEDKWEAMGSCDQAIGYNHVSNDTTDNAQRCNYSQLDENGLLKNKEYALKYFTPCVKNQKSRGTCSAFATVGALEIRLLKNKKTEYNLSEQFSYFYNEIYGGWWGRYQYGLNTMSALKKVKNKSLPIPLEKHWIYNPGRHMDPYDSSTKKHPKSCQNYSGQKCTNYAFQSNETISGINFNYTVPSRPKPHVMINSRYSFWNIFNPSGSLDTAINYLNNGDPIIVSFTVKSNFRNKGGGDNYVRYADRDGGGGHASVLVGFVKNDDLPSGVEKATEKGYFILRNSWGGGWADCGHIYVDYKYLRKYAYGLARITYNFQN